MYKASGSTGRRTSPSGTEDMSSASSANSFRERFESSIGRNLAGHVDRRMDSQSTGRMTGVARLAVYPVKGLHPLREEPSVLRTTRAAPLCRYRAPVGEGLPRHDRPCSPLRLDGPTPALEFGPNQILTERELRFAERVETCQPPWQGDLTVDLPGKAGVSLTGRQFRAYLVPH